jgi:propionyl-CoA carboxylase alpha chain
MIRVGVGATSWPSARRIVKIDGWAIESRLYAEDPYRGFLPSRSAGWSRYETARGRRRRRSYTVIRNDSGVREGERDLDVSTTR